MGKTIDEMLAAAATGPDRLACLVEEAAAAAPQESEADARARWFFQNLHSAAGSLVRYLERGGVGGAVYSVSARDTVAIMARTSAPDCAPVVFVVSPRPGVVRVGFGVGWTLTAARKEREQAIPAAGDVGAFNAFLLWLADAAHQWLRWGAPPDGSKR